ncbi:MAG: hypothetical protein AAGF12_32795 [Myxococcota bacterium]
MSPGRGSWIRTFGGRLVDRPSSALGYIVYCRCFGIASAIHLTLPDAMQPGWLVPNLIYGAGVVLLAVRGAVLGWILAAAGLLLPLLFFGDQLTQSAYLLACAASAPVLLSGGRESGREARATVFLAVVRALTIGTYALAALHKANRDFFDPTVSCASAGLTILAENWSLPFVAAPGLLDAAPILFLLAEVGFVLGLIYRPLPSFVFGFLLHIPLTIVFAPSFAFIMISGWAAMLDDEELRWLGRTFRRRWRVILGVGGGLGLLSFALYMRDHWVVYAYWSLKEAMLWVGLVWVLCALPDRPPPSFRWRRRALLWPLAVVLTLWTAHGLLPYSGLKFHHAGAMLSNLRVDRGCWNSHVFPEALRQVDPYLRVVDADVSGPNPALEEAIEAGLWNRRSFVRAAERWCAETEGIRLRGTVGGESFEVNDLCAGWPFDAPLFPNARFHQENLLAECPQQCIH